MQKNISVILILLFITTSCQVQNSKKFLVLVSDTSKTHQPYNEINFSIKKSSLLNLPVITKGVDSFELRIWYWGFVGGRKLINLRYNDNRWIGSETQYLSTQNNLDSSFSQSIIIPKDINLIVKYLTSDLILNLPSQQAIPNFVDDIADGQGTFIEISTNSFYKALDYHCPEHYHDQYNRKFLEVVLLLNKYFNFYFPWCKPST